MAKININVKEVDSKKNEPIFNIDDLVNMVNEKYECLNDQNMDNYIALEIDYNINYTVEQLKHIMKYYELSTRKKNKGELVEDLVIFELDPENICVVSHRKYLWTCVDAINEDPYLSKFLNIRT
tara:strand:- start:2699 stop:3070 length:372 start_codon:yes stop_codon:yes gene_type:complete